MNPRDLPILNKGQHITAEHYAAVTRSARAQVGIPNSTYDGDGIYVRHTPSKPRQVQVKSTVNIPVGSIFEILEGSNDDPPIYTVSTYDPLRTIHIYATNELNTIYADGYGIATIIGEYPVKVRVDSGGDTPSALSEFGMVGSTFSFDALGTGLICLTSPDDRGYIEVVKAADAGSGGSNTTTGCGCCNSFNCAGDEYAVVGDCVNCPNGAPLQYLVDIGLWNGHPELSGVLVLNFVSGCVWESATKLFVSKGNWTPSTIYWTGDSVFNDSGKTYLCTSDGTSGSGSGPTGTGTGITDGTTTWDYSA